MRRETCPYCDRPVDVLDADQGRMVQCDKVRCGKFFLATSNRAAPITTVVARQPASAVVAPRLTGAHVCQVCKGEISKALGRRRCTVLHRPARIEGAAPRDNCRMDVYAAIYYCPHCRPFTLLETPYSQWGQNVICPTCKRSFEAPRDDVLHERPADTREGTPMDFACPNCAAELRCDSTRGGKSMAGARVVCHSCLHMITVPACGERAAVAR